MKSLEGCVRLCAGRHATNTANKLNKLHGCSGAEDEAMAELNLEDYDESDEEESGRRIFGSSNPGMAFYRCVISQLLQPEALKLTCISSCHTWVQAGILMLSSVHDI